MSPTKYQADLNETRKYLTDLVSGEISAEAKAWLNDKIEQLTNDFRARDFYLTFSLVPRKTGKTPLSLSAEQKEKANELRPGFDPENLTVDQAVRILLVLTIPHEDVAGYKKILNMIFSTGEVSELVALYSGLPLYPHPEELKDRAAEGVRTNMTVVFDAIALNNPFPADYMDEDAWNQMVLKAVFMERPLDKIYGIDQRANDNLAKMLSDYAHERWAAKRYVTPELWRPVGPFIDGQLIEDFKRLFNDGEDIEKEAAALASSQSKSEEAKSLLNNYPDLKTKVELNEINWKLISEKWNKEKP